MSQLNGTPRACPALLIVLALGSSGSWLAGCSGGEDVPKQPNLLLIAVDTLRADHLGAYGYGPPTSAAIDALFEQSVVFEEAHSSSSWTLPSFVSMMTSLLPATHGARRYGSRLDPSYVTLAEVLAEAGYDTVGVVSHVFLGSRHGLAQGFREYDESLLESGTNTHHLVSSPFVTDRAIQHLERWSADPAGAPFFLFLHYFDPHFDLIRHEGISEGFADVGATPGLYDGEIAFTDRHLARLFAELERLGQGEDTLVVFVADHGEEFMEHGGMGHGRTLHREVVRVPMAIRAPGFAPRRVAQPVSSLDLMPTLLELLGVKAGAAPMAGRSLAPLMAGRDVPEVPIVMESRIPIRREAFVEAYVDGRWKLIVETPRHRGRARRLGRPVKPKSFMLFDLASDPSEQEDVSAAQPEIVARMRMALNSALREAKLAKEHFRVSRDLELSEQDVNQLKALGYTDAGEEAAED